MGEDDIVKPFPRKRIKRTPEEVRNLKISEQVLRDPRMQYHQMRRVLKVISQEKWPRDVKRMQEVRKTLPRTREELGMLLAKSTEKDWRRDPLYYWVVCVDYDRTMTKAEHIALKDDPGDADPPKPDDR